jgi:hypothetical protein
MIVHIVMMKLKNKADAAEVKRRLETLPAVIPEIKAYEIGINELESERAFHISLYSQFESYEALAVYGANPEHQKVLAYIGEVVAAVHSVDYTL